MKNYVLVLFLGLIIVNWSCKKGAGDDPVASETELVNSPDPKKFLSGEFPAVYIKWAGTYAPTIEGQDYAFTPDPKAITGNYKLIVEPNGSDSLKLYIDGSGTGPTFQKAPLGSFSYANFNGNVKKANSGDSGEYLYGVWNLKDKLVAPGNNRVIVERYAYHTKTDFKFRIIVGYVFGTGSSYAGRYIPYINDVADITVNDIRQIGEFHFARESPGALKW